MVNGRTLIGTAWRCLRRDRELITLPIVGSVATAMAAAPVVVATWMAGVKDGLAAYAAGAALLFLTTAVATFFAVALSAGANERLSGGDPTLRSSLAVARSRIGVILGWALCATVVGTLLRLVREKVKFVGWLVALFGDLAWAVATYFVVPAIATGNGTTMDVIRNSAQTMRARWGKAARVESRMFVYGLAVGAATVIGIGAAIFVGVSWPVIGIILGLVTVCGTLVAVLVLQALSNYVRVVLWRYAQGLPVPGFDQQQLATAVRSRP